MQKLLLATLVAAGAALATAAAFSPALEAG